MVVVAAAAALLREQPQLPVLRRRRGTPADHAAAMRVETVHVLVDDQADADHHRAVWLLVDALSIVGARDRVVPALLALFEDAIRTWADRRPNSGSAPGQPGYLAADTRDAAD